MRRVALICVRDQMTLHWLDRAHDDDDDDDKNNFGISSFYIRTDFVYCDLVNWFFSTYFSLFIRFVAQQLIRLIFTLSRNHLIVWLHLIKRMQTIKWMLKGRKRSKKEEERARQSQQTNWLIDIFRRCVVSDSTMFIRISPSSLSHNAHKNIVWNWIIVCAYRSSLCFRACACVC